MISSSPPQHFWEVGSREKKYFVASPLIILMHGSYLVGQGQVSGGTARAVSEVGLSREGKKEADPVVAAINFGSVICGFLISPL